MHVPRHLKWILVALLLGTCAYAEDVQTLWQRALLRHQAGDLPGALEAYKEVLRVAPNRFDARSNYGAVLAALGRYPEAVEQYRQALAIGPPQGAGR